MTEANTPPIDSPSSDVEILIGDSRDVLSRLEVQSVQCCVTSPPYFGLRDYEHAEQIGAEASPEDYVENLVRIFREVRRVLRDDGTLWLNVGDGYARNGGTGKSGPNAQVGNALTIKPCQPPLAMGIS